MVAVVLVIDKMANRNIAVVEIVMYDILIANLQDVSV